MRVFVQSGSSVKEVSGSTFLLVYAEEEDSRVQVFGEGDPIPLLGSLQEMARRQGIQAEVSAVAGDLARHGGARLEAIDPDHAVGGRDPETRVPILSGERVLES